MTSTKPVPSHFRIRHDLHRFFSGVEENVEGMVLGSCRAIIRVRGRNQLIQKVPVTPTSCGWTFSRFRVRGRRASAPISTSPNFTRIRPKGTSCSKQFMICSRKRLFCHRTSHATRLFWAHRTNIPGPLKHTSSYMRAFADDFFSVLLQ